MVFHALLENVPAQDGTVHGKWLTGATQWFACKQLLATWDSIALT